jgi:nucleotide-binding universal stress UspA family protein
MKTIVAATDMSANSRPALRFAIRLAAAMNARLLVVHVHYVLRASMWTDGQYQFYQHKTIQVLSNELDAFVKSLRYKLATGPIMIATALYHHLDIVSGIMEFSRQKGADYICVGTHGAGLAGRLIGTNAARLISHSKIPVLSIPATYRQRNFSSVLYATDMVNCEAELEQVVSFAKPLGLTLNLLHLYHAYELPPDKEIIEQSLERKVGYRVNVHYVPRNPDRSLLDDINAALSEFRPWVLAMFTKQDRDFMERIIASSATRQYAFISRLPLLSFAKATALAPEKSSGKKRAIKPVHAELMLNSGR